MRFFILGFNIHFLSWVRLTRLKLDKNHENIRIFILKFLFHGPITSMFYYPNIIFISYVLIIDKN